MPELKSLGKERELTIFYDNEPITLTYRRGAVTTEWQEAVAECPRDDAETFYRLLTQVIVNWDITEGGKPLKVTAANMKKLPLDLVVQMCESVLDACVPKKLRYDNSAAGSPPAGESESALPGTSLSR